MLRAPTVPRRLLALGGSPGAGTILVLMLPHLTISGCLPSHSPALRQLFPSSFTNLACAAMPGALGEGATAARRGCARPSAPTEPLSAAGAPVFSAAAGGAVRGRPEGAVRGRGAAPALGADSHMPPCLKRLRGAGGEGEDAQTAPQPAPPPPRPGDAEAPAPRVALGERRSVRTARPAAPARGRPLPPAEPRRSCSRVGRPRGAKPGPAAAGG